MQVTQTGLSSLGDERLFIQEGFVYDELSEIQQGVFYAAGN